MCWTCRTCTRCKGTPCLVAPSYDQLRAPQEQVEPDGQGLDPAVFYIGRVARSFDTDKSQSFAQDTESLIDRQERTQFAA